MLQKGNLNVERCQSVVESPIFQWSLALILIVDGLVLLLQMWRQELVIYPQVADVLLVLIVLLMTIENGVRFRAVFPHWQQYFTNIWHLFDIAMLLVLVLFPTQRYVIFLRLPRALRVVLAPARLSFFKGWTLFKTLRRFWRSQVTLRAHQTLLKVLFDRIPLILIVFEPKGKIQLANAMVQQLNEAQELPQYTHELWRQYYPDTQQNQHFQDWLETSQGRWQDFSTQVCANETREIAWACLPLWQRTYLAIGQDVTERKQMAAQLQWQATHDPLTRLLNRQAFESNLQDVITAARSRDVSAIFCYLDLDRFKLINDSCGHLAGDEALRQVAALIQENLPSETLIGRLGGDEFGFLLHNCNPEQGQEIAETLRAAVADYRFRWQEQNFAIGMSLGLVSLDETLPRLKDILAIADAACYVAKHQGRNCVYTYRPDDEQLAEQQCDRHWIQRIQTALAEDRFCLYAQEIVPLSPRHQRRFYEIFIRFVDERGQHIGAQDFLPAAERCDLMPSLDRWVITHFLTVCAPFLSRQAQDFDIHYAINLSGASINNEVFCNFLFQTLQNHADFAPRLCFEITETVAIANLTRAKIFMDRVKALGCTFALDDFGSGMSSLTYLQQLPVDYLKIDGLFVRDIVENPVSQAMVEGCHRIAHVMGLKTMAEHVKDEAIVRILQEIGIDYAQGYSLGYPNELLPADPPFMQN